MTFYDIGQTVVLLAILVGVGYAVDTIADRLGIAPGDGSATTIFLVAMPWVILAGWFIYMGKWNGAAFLALLSLSTAFTAWAGYRIGRWMYADAYFTAVLGGFIGLFGFGTILAINLLN